MPLTLILLALLATISPSLLAAASGDRPKIALVLGGGGARGGAHIGVIEVLEEYRVPIDIVVGTSMGSIVGGLYASGYSPEALSKLLSNVDWGELFVDSPPRKDLSIRRKQDDEGFLVKPQVGLGAEGLRLPMGVLTGQKMKLFLKRSALHVAQIDHFDELPIPYRAVTTDIVSGRFVALERGDLAEAMSASMAVPAFLAPVNIDGNMYVDGGVTNNLPVDVAKAMGADVVIAVDVGTPLAAKEELQSLLDITGQLTTMLTRTNADRRRDLLGPRDILIEPKLGNISSSDFGKTLETVALGREATEVHAQALARLALSEQAFTAHIDPRRRAATEFVSTQRIEIASETASEVEKTFLLRKMRIPSEPELHVDELEHGIGRAYGLTIFEEVSYDAEVDGVNVKPTRKSWGPNFLRMGLNVSGDMAGRTQFSLGASITATELNLPGAEWRTELEVGSLARIFSELYQPFRPVGQGFLAPSVEFRAFNFGLYGNENLIAEYRVRSLMGTLAMGAELSNWGEMRFGISKGTASSDLLVGDPLLRDPDDDLGLVFFRFSSDTLDNLYFPGTGLRTKFEWRKSDARIGGEESFEAIEFDSVLAASTGRHHVILAARGGSVYDGRANVLQAFQLGGFLNLSGLEPNQLTGQQMFLGRVVYLGQMARSLFLPSYLGMSLEAGEVWQDRDDVSLGDLRIAGSIFIGFDTILGPFYLGGGWVEGGDRAMYIRLGKTF